MVNLMNNGLRRSAMTNMIWKFGERVIAQFVSLVVSIILARLLTPDDYSIVGIVSIFFAFANVFISSGLNTALIQKKDADINDYSTVLIVSVIISIVIYIILFFSAPWIANIYQKKLLISVFRVMGIVLIINALKSVLCAYISSRLEFRKFFFATIGGTLVSAVIGIVMAIKGYGPWALVAQQMSNSLIDTLILYLSTRFKIKFVVVLDRLKVLYRFGWKIFVASIISTIYDEINPLIIGIKYTPSDLSYYTKGRSFPNLLNSTISDTFSAVLFPVMAKMQDDKDTLLSYTRQFMKTASFVIFPLMLGFLAVSDEFVRVVLTEKWMPASIYIKLFCVSYMFNIVQNGNLQVIRAIGRSDIILILEIIKKTAYFLVILSFVLLSKTPTLLAAATIINTLIATVVNTYPNSKLIGYTYKMLLQDITPNLVLSFIMVTAVHFIGMINLDHIALLVIQVLTGIVVYSMLSVLTKNKGMQSLLPMFKDILANRRHV